jgi:hypothetical protein
MEILAVRRPVVGCIAWLGVDVAEAKGGATKSARIKKTALIVGDRRVQIHNPFWNEHRNAQILY